MKSTETACMDVPSGVSVRALGGEGEGSSRALRHLTNVLMIDASDMSIVVVIR